jgi:regulatory protein
MKPAGALNDDLCWDLAVRYLSRSDKSNAEVALYLARQGVSSATAKATVRRLERMGYLNDTAHAMRWAERRLARKPMGRPRLRLELLRRGFPEKLADATLDKLYAEMDEADLAREAAKSSDRRTERNMGRFLQSRGFSSATIASFLHMEIED